jgi:hypothetical protein
VFGIPEKRGGGEQQVVDPQKGQHQRHLVDPIGDEDAGGKQYDQCDRRDVAQRAPPVLTGMKDEERDDHRKRRRVEHVGRPRAEHVLADNGDGRRGRRHVPRLLRAQDHRDKKPGEHRAAGKLPRTS